MDKLIAITLFRRPDLTASLFSALKKCYGLDDYAVLISCDVDEQYLGDCNQVVELATEFLHERKQLTQLHVNSPRLGVDLNKLFLLPKAFELSNYVIFLEDDTPPAQDALRFFEACNQKYKNDPTVVSVSSYNRYLATEEHARVLAQEPYAMDQGNGFCPWGWAMWRDRYEKTMGTGEAYKERWKDEVNGRFDWWITDTMGSIPGARTIYPVLPRTNHVGGDRAEHTPSEQYLMSHEFAPYGAWTQHMPDPVLMGYEWWLK